MYHRSVKFDLKTGRDVDGFDLDGFNPAGIDRTGMDRYGRDYEGRDADGYDINGINSNGYDRNGKYYSSEPSISVWHLLITIVGAGVLTLITHIHLLCP